MLDVVHLYRGALRVPAVSQCQKPGVLAIGGADPPGGGLGVPWGEVPGRRPGCRDGACVRPGR